MMGKREGGQVPCCCRLDQLPRARLRIECRRRRMPSFEEAPSVGDAVGLDEAAIQEEAPPVGLTPPRHNGFQAHPAAFGCQPLGILEHSLTEPSIPRFPCRLFPAARP